MKNWFIYALTATCIWGVWGCLAKHVSKTLNWQTIFLLSALGAGIAAPFVALLVYKAAELESWNHPVVVIGILLGVLGSAGTFFFYMAVSSGEVSKVSVITSLYPVITVTLAYFFLKEGFDLNKTIGICLALTGIYFLAK